MGLDGRPNFKIDTESKELRFFEAKHFSNSEIRAEPGRTPKIVTQMNRYKKQLSNKKVRDEILAAYRDHVDILNRLLSPQEPIPLPRYLDEEPRLLVFGYDSKQQQKIVDEIILLKTDYSIVPYTIGDIKRAKPGTIFRCGR